MSRRDINRVCKLIDSRLEMLSRKKAEDFR